MLTLKYGKKLMHLFSLPGGKFIRKWLIDCDNDTYNALVFRGGKAFREELMISIGQEQHVADTLNRYDDAELLDVMSNLGGHCLEVSIFCHIQMLSD